MSCQLIIELLNVSRAILEHMNHGEVVTDTTGMLTFATKKLAICASFTFLIWLAGAAVCLLACISVENFTLVKSILDVGAVINMFSELLNHADTGEARRFCPRACLLFLFLIKKHDWSHFTYFLVGFCNKTTRFYCNYRNLHLLINSYTFERNCLHLKYILSSLVWKFARCNFMTTDATIASCLRGDAHDVTNSMDADFTGQMSLRRGIKGMLVFISIKFTYYLESSTCSISALVTLLIMFHARGQF